MSTVFQTSQEAFEWLRSQIAVVKAGDPLAPATVLVANHYVDTLAFHTISGSEIIDKFGYRECPKR